MNNVSELLLHRPIVRSVVAALGGMLLATSIVTAQDSPTPDGSAAPTTVEPAASPGTAPPASTLQPRRWSLAQTPPRRAGWAFHDVIAGGPGFIAVGGGSQGKARSSPQAIIWLSNARGRDWQAAPLFGSAADGTIRGITATEDGFVAVGDGAEGGAIWRSSDGIGWRRLPHDAVFDSSSILDVADGPAGLIAVGCQGETGCATSRAWRSTDGGTTWASLEAPPPGLAAAIASTDAGYLVAGRSTTDGNPMLVSTSDGQAWQAATGLPAGPASLAALGSLGDALAGGHSTESGADRALLLRSADGSAWQSISHRSFKAADLAAIADGPSGAFLLGSRSQRVDGRRRTRPLALWSSDLTRFRATPFPGQSLRAGGEVDAAAFSADGSVVVAVGATARPMPAIWFNQLAEPAARGDQPIDQAVTTEESPSAPPSEAPAT